MKSRISGLAAVALAVALSAAPAGAATFNATVRVEGTNQTLLPTTSVTLDPATPVHLADATCSGDSAAAALDQAAKGNWDRKSFTQTILGETHKFDNNDYWALWVSEKFAQNGICDQKLTAGDRMLILADVSGPSPDFAPTVYPIAITGAPTSANRGDTATVSVIQYGTDGSSAPLAGAAIGGGASTVTTGSDGRATVTFDHTGQVALKAVKGSERSDVAGVCVHAGNDGTCGTSTPAAPAPPPAAAPVRDLTAPVGRSAIDEGHVFGHGKGPRILSGIVSTDPSGLLLLKLRVTRDDHGRCSGYSSKRERFIRTKCGAAHGWYFSLANPSATWSYLLPERLGPGRYVLDVEAVDKAYNRDTQRRRGDNRVVFTVR